MYNINIPSTDVIQLTSTLKMTVPYRLSKRQSLSTTTVLFRTTFTRTIKLNLLLTMYITTKYFWFIIFFYVLLIYLLNDNLKLHNYKDF